MIKIKQLALVVLSLLMFSGVAIAQDPASSITVGPVMKVEYIAPDPKDKDVQPPETVQKLLDKKVIQAAEAANTNRKELKIVNTGE